MSYNDHGGHDRQVHVSQAVDALGAYIAHEAAAYSDGELLVTLSDLAGIANLVGQLAAQSRQELATWATVGTHLEQAQQYAAGLARCLNHACGTLAFNSTVQSVAA